MSEIIPLIPPFGPIAHPIPIEIEEDTELYAEVVSRMRERMGVGKPRPGIHVSELIYCLLKGWALRQYDTEAKRLNVSRADLGVGDPEDETVFVWVIGHSHEAIFGNGSVRGKSEVRDGIWYTPDFFYVKPNELLALDEFFEIARLTEMKSTRASAKKRMDDGEMQHYLDQVASYAAAEDRDDAWVWVFHINGDYYHQTTEGKARGAGPHALLRLWRLKFTKQMRDRWWEELIRRKGILEGTEAPEPLPMFEWECGYCPVRELIKCPGGAEWQLKQSRKRTAKPENMDN